MMVNKQYARQKGFTLIEVMITLLISGVIVATIYSAYRAQQKSYLEQEQVAEMQQNLRAAMQHLVADIRMAGFDSTKTAGATITTATIGQFAFTSDFTGGESDGNDNDDDGRTDDDGTPPDDDEHFYGNGNTNDPNEEVAYALTDGNNIEADGIIDAGPAFLARDVNGDGLNAAQSEIAMNIERIEFFYTLDDGTTSFDPVADGESRDDIRTVEVALLARANKADRNFTHLTTTTYTTPGGTSWNIAVEDNFRRRFVTMTIQARNMGL